MTDRSRNLWYFVAAIAAIVLVQGFWTSRNPPASVPYSELQRLLREKKVKEISISASEIRGQLKEPLPAGQSEFVTTRVDAELASGLEKSGVKFLGGHDEKEQTLNQLLAELDGFDPTGGIVLLGSTNRPEILDPALLRAGRFDRQILVDRPDRRGRAEILRVHLPKVTVAEGFDVDDVAAMTPGFTGADLANLVNEATLVATRRDAVAVELADFTAAIERIVAGLEKRNRLLNPREREVVAHHEMGHALVAAALPGSDPVHKVSIIPRGIAALGYTLQRPTEDRYLMTRTELESRLAVLQGGRVAEQLIFGQISTGAANDLSRSTEIARSMVTRFAMAPGLGHVTFETEPSGYLGLVAPPQRSYSEETAREIDCALRAIVEAAFQQARSVLARNRELLESGARELLAKESLAGDELARLLDRVQVGAPLAKPVAA